MYFKKKEKITNKQTTKKKDQIVFGGFYIRGWDKKG